MARTGLYKLTDGDRAIIEKARIEKNVNIFTNYYMRSEDSGTWYRPIPETKLNKLEMEETRAAAMRWSDLYDSLFIVWHELGMPHYFAVSPTNPDDWIVLDNEEAFTAERQKMTECYQAVKDQDGEIVFFRPHGAIMFGWQLEMTKANQPINVVPGGYGSGKTWAKMLDALYKAATLKGYRALCVAPNSDMINAMFSEALAIITGTLYEERFLVQVLKSPRMRIVVGNDDVGQSSLDFYPIMIGEQDNSKKLLTLTADEAIIDQAEQIMEIANLRRNLGSRLRGQVRGRPRVGKMTFLANSAFNDELYDMADESEKDPDHVWTYSPGSFENPYLTIDDLLRFEKDVGRDEESRRMYIRGERPYGSGEHFNAMSIAKCKAPWLDDQMIKANRIGKKGWSKKEGHRAGIVRWISPPDPLKRYIVAADPGWSNPPERNSPAIGVFDVTDFPRTPAALAAFDWVYGNNSPNPWIASFTEFVINYQAVGMCGFDSTGFQSGYERMTDINILLPTPISLAGNNKYVYLNFAKKLVADGLFQFPTIPHLFSQMAKYRLPDTNLKQDIVSMLFVAAALLEPMYYAMINDVDLDDDQLPNNDRYKRDISDRYDRPMAARR